MIKYIEPKEKKSKSDIMPLFYKTISESEAFYSIKEGELAISGGGQSSYNLPKPFFRYVKDNNILIHDPHFHYPRRKIDGNAFVLHEDYEFKLGSGVLSLIGQGYEKFDNQFIASLNGTNNKFQVYRKVYDELGWRYEWFVELYDKNLSGNELILHIDENNEIFTIDIQFSLIDQNDYHEYLKTHPLRL